MREWETYEDEKALEAADYHFIKETIEEDKEHTSISAQALLYKDLPPCKYYVDNLIPEGAMVLAGASKSGKSWLVLDLCIAIAKGGYFLDHKCNKADVIYYSLEDNLRRLQDRLKTVLRGEEAPSNLEFRLEIQRFDEGLLDVLRYRIDENPQLGLIVIDTMHFIKPTGITSKNEYDSYYKVLGDIANLAREKHITIILVHHTKKSNGFITDPFEQILGTTAIQGAVDTIAILKRDLEAKDEGEFHIKGKDIEQQELSLRFINCIWKNEGDLELKKQRKIEEAYNSHPAVITLKKKLEQIQQDDNEPIKEYVTTMKGFRNDVIEVTGELVGTGEKNFSNIVKEFDYLLKKDNITHIEPKGRTTYRSQKGLFHRYYIKK